jgi:large subunit ribosomal protein L6
MSRIGKKPVPLPDGVQVTVQDHKVKAKGPKGELTWPLPESVTVSVDAEAGLIRVARASDERQDKALHGLTRALIANMVTGVNQGYERGLEIYGTGYNCKLEGRNLVLNLGFSGRGMGRPGQFVVPVPEGLEVQILAPAARGETDPAKLVIRGVDKGKVGQFAAEVRGLRKPEPYQGKGVRYAGEQIKRKAGKAFAGGAG